MPKYRIKNGYRNAGAIKEYTEEEAKSWPDRLELVKDEEAKPAEETKPTEPVVPVVEQEVTPMVLDPFADPVGFPLGSTGPELKTDKRKK